jgi:hypothetical protein
MGYLYGFTQRIERAVYQRMKPLSMSKSESKVLAMMARDRLAIDA